MDEATRRLWRRCKEGRDASAREELVLANLPLVRFIVRRLPVALLPDLGEEDLVSVGALALLRSVDDFDPERGVAFATFAVPRIRGAVLDELRAHDRVPRSVRQRARAIERARRALAQDGLATPSLDEIGRETGLAPDEIERTVAAAGLRPQWSLDGQGRTASEGGDRGLLGGAADPTAPPPLAALLADERKALLAEAVEALPEADRRVVTLHYQRDVRFKDIARRLAVTKARVSQIHARALGRLREHLSGPSSGPAPP